MCAPPCPCVNTATPDRGYPGHGGLGSSLVCVSNEVRSPADRRAEVRRGRLRLVVALASILVLVTTGLAWRSIDSLRSNLATAGGLGLGGGADGAVDILLVGTDSRTDAHGNPLSQQELDTLRAGEEAATNTDTILLIRVPNDGSSATAISIPRDSYVDVPGIGESKINAAYGTTKATERERLVEEGESETEAERESSRAGREALVETVADLTGITVDHYAEVGLLGFVLLTDAVGGVDVCLNEAVDEPLSGANFTMGEQTLSGPDALSFVRQRHDLPRGDLDRIVRQQVFMASLANQVLSARTLSDPAKLSQLTRAVERSVVIDDDWDIVDFARQLQNLAGGDVQFDTIPVANLNGMTEWGESIVVVDPPEVRSFVAGLVGEDAGDETSESGSATTSPAPDIDPSTVTVDVANASAVSGLANAASAALAEIGYATGEVGNHTGTTPARTTVFAADPESDAARAVAASVGDVDIEADSSLSDDEVRVVLASDYSGPGVEGSATTAQTPTGTAPDGVTSADGTMTPVPPGPPITAGSDSPRCVN
ncbi:LytR family transcriptional regulator [Rhodococcus rhodnii]|uniref:LytR family transcriptional regulator n=1 Tax=Rhodococcus rhodnii TaxID=38312 RepID=A0A6P2CF44_9NOCA|nr:LytR family transcriptional regulator [Rhodococcus rhodnii]